MNTVGFGNLGIKKLLLDEKGNEEGGKEGVLTGDTPIEAEAPEAKPVTASIADVLAAYNKGGIEFISTTGKTDIPEGVSNYVVDGNDVTVYKRKALIRAQIIGINADDKAIVEKLPELAAVVTPDAGTEETENPSGVNGEIDEPVSQGGTGDCWILTGVLSLASTEVGKQIIKSSITANSDGSVTVTFKGIGVSYTISAEEIKKHDTDNIKGDAYSNGDNDMLVMELATEKLKADIESGKVTLNVDPASFEGYNGDGSIEGGFAAQMLYFLTGRTSDTYLSENPRQPNQVNFSEEEIYEIFQNALENDETALTFGIYDGTHTAQLTNGKTYKLALGNGGHALAVTNLTKDTVTFVNPWDSTKEYTMTWSEFAKLGVGLVSVTDLSGLEDLIEPEEPSPDAPLAPVEPDTPDDINVPKYTTDDLKGQGFTEDQIERYFDKLEDGSYVMKSDIIYRKQRPYPYRYDERSRYETIEITTIEELRKYCGADSRQKLKKEGFPDELIDKYFILTSNLQGSASYILDFTKYSNYIIVKLGEKTIIRLTMKDSSREEVITIDSDGNYSIEIERYMKAKEKDVIPKDDNIINANMGTYIYLKGLGLTDVLIEKFFDKPDISNMNIYLLKEDIEVLPGTGIYITSIEQLLKILKTMGVIE